MSGYVDSGRVNKHMLILIQQQCRKLITVNVECSIDAPLLVGESYLVI